MKTKARSLGSLISLSIHGLSILPLLLLFLAAGGVLARGYKADLEGTMSSLSTGLSSAATRSIEPAARILRSLREELALGADGRELERFMEATRLARPDVETIALLDASGRVLALSPRDDRRIADDLSGQPGFAESRQSRAPVYSSSYVSSIASKVTVACFLSFGDRTGLVLLDLATLSAQLDGLRLSGRDQAAVVDQRGRLVAHSDFHRVLERSYATQPLVPGRTERLRIEGRDWLAISRPLDGMGWRAVYYRDAEDAGRLVYWLFGSLALVALATIILSSLMALAIRRLLVRPFNAIFSQLTGIGEGDYALKGGADLPAELEALAGAIDHMARKIEGRELELQRSEERYRALFFGGEAPAFLVDLESGLIRDSNRAASSFYGWSAEEFRSLHIWDINSMGEEGSKRSIAGLERKQSLRMPSKHRLKDGSQREVEAFVTRLEIDGKDYIHSLIFDVTDRVRAEEQVKRDLELKNLLLREIHHRVKNNLQIVASLFYLQAETVGEPQLRAILRSSQDRIHSLALAHELVYRSPSLDAVDMGNYAGELVAGLLASHPVPGLSLNIGVEKVSLPLDRALNCGLLMNELVSNALIHGMDGKEPCLSVLMAVEPGPEGRPRIRLDVADGGPGLLPDASCPERPSLGFTLVQSLAEQLRGSLEWLSPRPGHEKAPCPGLLVRLRFPLEDVQEETGPSARD